MSREEFEGLLRERPDLFVYTRFYKLYTVDELEFARLKVYAKPMAAVSVEEYVGLITSETLAGKWEFDF